MLSKGIRTIHWTGLYLTSLSTPHFQRKMPKQHGTSYRPRSPAMDLVPTFTLLVIITLLRLNQAEISKSAREQWFSSNILQNGGYTLRPLTDLFPIGSTFSTDRPIVVGFPITQTSTSEEVSWTSANTGKTFSSTVPPKPHSSLDFTDKSLVTNSLWTQQKSSWPTTTPPSTHHDQLQSQTKPSQWPEVLFQTPPSFPIIKIPDPPTANQNPVLGQPNYIYIYQQAPQNIENVPRTSSPQTSNAHSSTFPPTPVVSTIPPSSVKITSPGTNRPSTSEFCSSTSTTVRPSKRATAATRVSKLSTSTPTLVNRDSGSQLTNWTIRVKSPRGSIAKVKINPSLTTTKPSVDRTEKTKRGNRSDLEECVNNCKKKQPICSRPRGSSPVDPDRLKGFPSLCHMACHNSFQKNAYEKVADGRCGRLRTRIRTGDSQNKLKREELNKAQYTIVHNGPQTVVEIGHSRP